MSHTNESSKKVFLMSLPIFLELMFQLLVGNIDQLMLSKFSQNSVAAVGNGNQIMNLVIVVLSTLCMGTTVMISQFLGADNKKRINEICNLSLWMIGALGLIVSSLVILMRRPLFHMMKVPAEIMDDTTQYLAVVGSFIAVQALYMVFASILRSFALVKEVMIASLVMNGLNIIGNAILINGMFGLPRLGILGAAISTNISKVIGLAILIYIFRKKKLAELSLRHLRPFPTASAKHLLFIGIPAGGQEFSYNTSQILILSFINFFGPQAITTKVYCSMMANLAYCYSLAIAQATQIVLGYMVGSNQLQPVRKRVMKTVYITWVVSLSVIALLYLNSDFVFGLFTNDPVVISLGKKILLVEFFLEIGRSVNIVMCKCLVSLGDVQYPVILSIISAWGIAVTLSYVLGVQQGWGLVGIWIAMAIDENLRGALFIHRFLKNKWKEKLSSIRI